MKRDSMRLLKVFFLLLLFFELVGASFSNFASALVLEQLNLAELIQNKSIGMYVGTFDPIHEAHMAAAETCIQNKVCDLVVVSAHSAFDSRKPDRAPFKSRQERVFKIYDKHPAVIVSKNMSFESIYIEITKHHPHQLVGIIGSDTLEKIVIVGPVALPDQWLVFERPIDIKDKDSEGRNFFQSEEEQKGLDGPERLSILAGKPVQYMKLDLPPLSSTQIREASKFFTQSWQEVTHQSQEQTDEVIETILSHYRVGRYYHNTSHILDCMSKLRDFKSSEDGKALALGERDWQFIEIALWFHDVIYDSKNAPHQNELESAQLFESMAAGSSEQDRAMIRSMILATAEHLKSDDPRINIVLDIDMSILGADESDFDRYERGIHKEYNHVPDYRAKRSKYLDLFLKQNEKSELFHLPYFKKKFEERANSNLIRALQKMQNFADL